MMPEPEIEITPEMIAAAFGALREVYLGDGRYEITTDTAEAVLRVALQLRRKS